MENEKRLKRGGKNTSKRRGEEEEDRQGRRRGSREGKTQLVVKGVNAGSKTEE